MCPANVAVDNPLALTQMPPTFLPPIFDCAPSLQSGTAATRLELACIKSPTSLMQTSMDTGGVRLPWPPSAERHPESRTGRSSSLCCSPPPGTSGPPGGWAPKANSWKTDLPKRGRRGRCQSLLLTVLQLTVTEQHKDFATHLPRPSSHSIVTFGYELPVEEAVENINLKGNETKMATGKNME